MLPGIPLCGPARDSIFRMLGIAARRWSCQVCSMRFPRFLLVFVLLAMPVLMHAQREKLPPEDLEFVNKTWPNAQRTSTGLRHVLLSEGKGELAKSGDMVKVLYTGWLLNGTVFDKSLDPEKPFQFRLGRNNVIDGWDQGLQLMRPGEKRLFIIPYELAYGTRGQLPSIPPRATLIFEVQLLEVKK